MEQNNSPKINGWLLVDKPTGITSTEIVRQIKKVLNLKKQKIGHGGTLDPLAEGLLPVAIGEATKTLNYVLNANKEYIFTIQFGMKTDSKDITGQVLKRNQKFPTNEEIVNTLPNFLGKIKQIPPQYSAIKINGERAYNLARNNIMVTMPTRIIEVFNLILLEYNVEKSTITLQAKVSKGTYIRSLAEDIAESVGCLGTILQLKRVSVGLKKENIFISGNSLYNLRDNLTKYLVRVEDMLVDILAYTLNEKEFRSIKNGNLQCLQTQTFPQGLLKLMFQGYIVALLESTGTNLRFVRVFNQ
ncbi:tRNA pseudouridine synthase B [Candidatus Hepatincola sp. Pdp]